MGLRMRDACGHLVGDIIPFYDGEEHKAHLFYLRGHPEGCGLARFDTPWAHCVTRDWKTIDVLPDAISKGLRGDCDDGACFTGCVYKKDGVFYLYYTSFSPYGDKSREMICLATSKDGVHFDKHPENPLFGPDYALYGASDDFRDPYVWYHEEEKCYWMVFAAGLMNSRCQTRRGAVGLAKSDDLRHWTLHAPLYAPNIYPSLECPDVFRIGDWYYLLFSQFGRTEYRMARSLEGPWLLPKRPCFDCGEYFFYAAKTLFDGKRRLLIGWCGQLKDGKDGHSALWGNAMVTPREIKADSDGELYLECPEEHRVSGEAQTHSFIGAFDETHGKGECVTVGRQDGFDAALIKGSDCGDYTLAVTVDMAGDRGLFGVVLRATDDLSQCYLLEFNRANRMMYFKRYASYSLFSGETVNMDIVLAEKSLHELGDSLTLSIHFEDGIMEAFAGRSVMTVPVAELARGKVGFSAAYGSATFHDIRFFPSV